MRAFFLSIVTILVFSLPLSSTVFADSPTASSTSSWLDTSQLTTGIIGIRYKAPADKATVVVIAKGSSSYTYNLSSSKTIEYFPLQLSDGSYTVSVLQNVSGTTKYKRLYNESVTLKLAKPSSVYLGSIQTVDWKNSKLVASKVTALNLKQGASDEEKVKAIHKYVVQTIRYDKELAKKVTSSYIPNIDNTIKTSKGICYDYAALFAGMARSQGIPTKLVMGTSDLVKGYHAWNEVYLDGKWIVIDTTFDAEAELKKVKYSLTKDTDKYKAAKVY